MKNSEAILERARNVFFSQWEEMLRLRLLVLKRCEQEDIHDLRVASRRFRATLKLLGPLCGNGSVPTLVKQIRSLTRTLGDLRNLDEALAFFGAHTEQMDLLSGLMGRLADQRELEQHEIIKALEGFKAKKLDSLVRAVVAGLTMDCLRSLNMAPLPSYLSNTSISLFETIQALLPAALCFENSEERHALRIAIKKWRYFLETVSVILEQDYATPLEQLKKYQTLLGSMNDMTVFGLLCREQEEAGDEPGKVAQLLEDESKRHFEEFVVLAAAEPLRYSFLI
ncbi:MAG: hypothetical protein CXR30_12410 [Geobacter sp.]|nr:MAG: hypothetical protein CXR30_12410 [Geobacter sp.]